MLYSKSLELLILQNWNSMSIEQQLPSFSSPPPRPLATTILLCFDHFDYFWYLTHKWDYSAFILLWMSYFTQHTVPKVRPHCHNWQGFLLFEGWMVFYFVCIYHTIFIHSLARGHLGCCHIWAVVNDAAVNMGVQTAFQDSDFSSFG